MGRFRTGPVRWYVEASPRDAINRWHAVRAQIARNAFTRVNHARQRHSTDRATSPGCSVETAFAWRTDLSSLAETPQDASLLLSLNGDTQRALAKSGRLELPVLIRFARELMIIVCGNAALIISVCAGLEAKLV
jgi:hypothetical protein